MTQQFRQTIPLNPNGTTRLGSDPALPLPLKHPLVALRHVEVTVGTGKARLRDFGSGTFVNGIRVLGRQVELDPGDQIDIGPFAFLFTGTALETISSLSSVQVTARNVSRTVPHRGEERFILDDVSLVLEPGQFVCLLGPSGCGKTTLMAALSGRNQPTMGQVLVNHRDLYEHFNVLKRHLALVPQKPVLHADLKLEEALWYTARLRLPRSVDRAAQVKQLIDRMQLEKHKSTLVRQLSGGQEKRACLANELLADPGLIFLDEVTSGLDENIDGELMRFFRELAERGKTVVCITHCLAHVVATCHRVVVLTPGGKLAYVGPPELALRYFNVASLGDIYSLLTEERADDWARKFRASSEYATFVSGRLPEGVPPTKPASPRPARVPLLQEALTFAAQSVLLTGRQLRLMWRDPASLRGLLGQVVLVALILIVAFGKIAPFPKEGDQVKADRKKKEQLDKKEQNNERMSLEERGDHEAAKRVERDYLPKSAIDRINHVRTVLNLLFLLAVVSFWLGCNNAAREIVRERTITTQERFFNLHTGAYYFSKLLVLTVIGWVQVLLLLSAVWYFCAPPLDVREPPEPAKTKSGEAQVQPPQEKPPLETATKLLPLLLALSFAGTTLGLFLSAIAPSESVAVTLIPIAVIPQIVLSGAIVQLGHLAEYFSELSITTYWGKSGMDSLLVGDAGDFARKAEIKLIDATDTFYPLLFILLQAFVFIVLALAALASDNTLRGSFDKVRNWGGKLFRLVGLGSRATR